MVLVEKDWSHFSTAEENEKVAEIVVINDGNDTRFAAFALVDGHQFALFIDVLNVEIDEFASANAEPPERFDSASIPEIAVA